MPTGVYDRGDPVARFWSHVNKDGPTMPHMDTNCWVWTGSAHKGYGQSNCRRAHRVAYELTNGPIPEGMWVLHACDHRPCVRHLFLGTHDDNMADCVAKGRQAKGDRNGARLHPERVARGSRHGANTRPERRPRGEDHGQAKITWAAVADIRRRHAAGEPATALGLEFGISCTHIFRILKGENWKAAP